MIIHWDSLEYMRTLADKSIDLVLTDPPYFWIVKNDWDNQWATRKDFIDWLELFTIEWKRILKDNWSLYIFWDDKVIAYVQVMMDKYFKLENSIVWYKPNNMTIKWWDCFRSYAPVTERLLFYSNENEHKWWSWVFQDVIDYMNEERYKAWLKTCKSINKILWVSTKWWWMAAHYFNWNKIYELPTKDMYKKLQTTWYFRKEYEELRKEYEELRRHFNPNENFTDVWTFNMTSQSEKWAWQHPTIKPLQIIKRIIETSSKPWDLVLDCFAWSGTTAVACIETGRKYIVIEKEADYVEIIKKRVKNTNTPLFTI